MDYTVMWANAESKRSLRKRGGKETEPQKHSTIHSAMHNQ